MKEIKCKDDENIVFMDVPRGTTLDDMQNYITQNINFWMDRDVVWNLSDIDFKYFFSDNMRSFIADNVETTANRKGHKSALVCEDEFGYGMLRMFCIVANGKLNFEMCAFKSIEAACSWINGDCLNDLQKINTKLEDGLVINTAAKAATLDDILIYIKSNNSYWAGKNILWDFSRLSFADISAEDIRNFINDTQELSISREELRVAVVAEDNLSFGMLRMLVLIAQTKYLHKIQAFRSLEEAKFWLMS